jgi:hypothetical protein
MTCDICAGKGVIRIGYRETPEGQSGSYRDYGVCTCPKGQRFRTENGMLALAARYGVPPDQVNLIEVLLDPEDFTVPTAAATTVTADVRDAGRSSRKAKL